MNIFEKGDFRKTPNNFRVKGLMALESLTEFQNEFNIYDTDSTINVIRDSIVANYLNFELLNFDKHGFDAKSSRQNRFLEVKQCSISSNRWGGTWNDTNEEKAKAFGDKRFYTVVGVWKGASDLEFMAFGQHQSLGEYLLGRVKNRKEGSRSTQNIAIEKLVKEYKFFIIFPPSKNKEVIYKLLVNYKRLFIDILGKNEIKEIRDVKI